MYGGVIPFWVVVAAVTIGAASLAYLLLAVIAVGSWTSRRQRVTEEIDEDLPPVSLLKPLCGDEVDLYRNLSSFCAQNYRRYQIAFGVMEENDPALQVVEALRRNYPDVDMTVVVDSSQLGCNRKISNLANMIRVAKYDHIVISDSDISVDPDYLRTVISELRKTGVGLVTCLYRARAAAGLVSRLGAMYVNEWFVPSVLVGRLLGYKSFSFGSTIAIRREVLEALGGFSVVAGHLADDYLIGELVRRNGLRTILSSYIVTNTVSDPGLRALWEHELRWARTIRSVQPVGYAFSAITHVFPVCLLMCLLSGAGSISLVVLAIAAALRVALHAVTRLGLRTGATWEVTLVPFRDLLTFVLFVKSFMGKEVRWRSGRFSIRPDGSLNPRQEAETP